MNETMGQQDMNEVITRITEKISDALKPDRIFLFGSHAWGEPTADSDIDLFVIVKDSDQPPYRRSREVYRFLRGIREPVEVVVRTTDEVEKSKSVVTSLTKKVLEQGKLLYG